MFNNGHRYHVFLKGRDVKDPHLQQLEDVLYQVTVRNVEKKNQIFDFHISLMLARQIFKTKTASQKEIDEKLIVFDRNREGFKALLECVNIKDDEIVIDFKLFNEIGHSAKKYYDLPQHQIVEINEQDSEVPSEYDEEYNEVIESEVINESQTTSHVHH